MRYFEVRKGRIEIIPMIDIMLFLLVFFIMITLHMIPNTGIDTRLPSSSSAQQLPGEPLVLELRQDGSLRLSGKSLTLAQLQQKLAQHDPGNTRIVVAGASEVTLQRLVSVMDACRNAGINQLGIATLNTDQP